MVLRDPKKEPANRGQTANEQGSIDEPTTTELNNPDLMLDPDVQRLEPDEVDDTLDYHEDDANDMAVLHDTGEVSEEKDDSELQRVECLQHDAIINGHRVAHGHVIEMNMHDVYKHRRHGVAISDPLSDDDKREVDVDVTKPFQPEQNEVA